MDDLTRMFLGRVPEGQGPQYTLNLYVSLSVRASVKEKKIIETHILNSQHDKKYDCKVRHY